MKKLFTIIAVALSVAALTSCETTNNGLDLDYNIEATAKVNGHVVFGTPVGDFTMNGNGDATFLSKKDTVSYDAPLCGAVLESPAEYDKDLVNFAQQVANSAWEVKEAEGDVQVDATGYVLETNTGLILAIDFHWPNQPNEVAAPADSTVVE